MTQNLAQTVEIDQLAYFELVQTGYRRAEAAAGGALARFYRLGTFTIRVLYAGPAMLERLDPTLAHLYAAPTDQPDLTICAWDSVSTGAPLPLLLSSLVQLCHLRWFEQLAGRMEIKDYNSARIHTSFDPGPDILSALDTVTDLAFYWVEDAAQLPFYIQVQPFRHILTNWAASRGLYRMHAAAVGGAAGGVLIAGPPRAGKSTTTLACLASDLRIAGDDSTFVDAVDGAPHAYSIYSSVKLRTLDLLPQLAPGVVKSPDYNEEKLVCFLAERCPEKIVTDFPVRAVLLPHVNGGADTWLRPASLALALKTLAPSTLLQAPNSGQSSLRAMANLIRQVPCYTLELGTDLTQIPLVISRLLRELA